MKKFLFFTILFGCFFLMQQTAVAQGCVAIRHFSGCGSSSGGGPAYYQSGEWLVNTNYRYFKSFRHFRGTEEEPQRIENNTEVINWQHALDFSVSHAFSSRFALNLTLPLVYNERSSLYEHGGAERHETSSYGLGDMRIGTSYWLYDPYNSKGNIMVGLGLKLPTGDAGVEDRFYTSSGSTEIRQVDQSIQPGDGGVGITSQIHMGRQISESIGLFMGGFYILNPREMNETPARGPAEYMSVADQYGLRGGATIGLPMQRWSLLIGGRYEAIPAEDLIGGSEGYRRPGYVWSMEPGIFYGTENFTLGLNVPVAVDRGRPQSVNDRHIEEMTGERTIGDAAFADYLINIDFTWRFGGSKNELQIFDR